MRKVSDELPIGIFDSGVGGLTVMKELIKLLPGENMIYFGDTARVPYGTRSRETVTKYSIENTEFLMSKGIKALVVACNTVSSISLPLLRREFPVPVIGVVEPGARAAAAATKLKRVAVIGTEATVNSRSYEDAINALDASIQVSGIACPLFVPLIEEGWLDGEIVKLTVEKYLLSLRHNGVDSLVLGCTHYPMIKDIIKEVTEVPLIDSAVETAKEVMRILEEKEMLRQSREEGSREFFVTDFPEKFSRVGERFLDHKINNITKIDL
ncbi:MAG TPA: glutamate racemase [Nitrospirae bacterium]|nr:glutamate racemase 1 [bacterium BMS3Abin09]GBE41303.1 glutamate racemase 1 [bacterium BMS3Bbin09]HDN94675.1 glutamate racemase [Nitrospirota bacterium]HDO67366.1 glutamate racemase [Nitrospirota bacterium]HDZ84187.1 glutamate racemase [Nitrospirota bacterium]